MKASNIYTALVCTVSIFVLSCGGGDNNSQTIEIVTETQNIRAIEGGVLDFGDGSRLVIPPSALPEDTEITVSKHSDNLRFSFEPDGLVLNTPATLEVPVTNDMISDDTKVISAYLYSNKSPLKDSVSEKIKAERIYTSMAMDMDNGDLVKLELNHFSVADITIKDSLYLPINIPSGLLKPADIVFSLSFENSLSENGPFDWFPGHVGMIIGDSNSLNNCGRSKTSKCDMIESVPDYVKYSNYNEEFINVGHHVGMGVRRPIKGATTDPDREDIVNWAAKQIGKPWEIINHYDILSLDYTKFSCVGLVDAAYRNTGNIIWNWDFGLIIPIEKDTHSITPYELYTKTEQINHINVSSGETIQFQVNPVFLDQGKNWYLDYRSLDTESNRDGFDFSVDNLPEGAEFDPKTGLFTYKVPETVASVSTKIVFNLSVPYSRWLGSGSKIISISQDMKITINQKADDDIGAPEPPTFLSSVGEVSVGEEVSLSVQRGFDPEDDQVKVVCDATDHGSESTDFEAGGTSEVLSFTFSTAGTKTVSCFTEDTEGNTSTNATLDIEVKEPVVSKPDLVIVGALVQKSASPGDEVTAVVAVKNQGGADSGAFKTGYYLSTNSNITTSDTRIYSCNHGSGVSAGAADFSCDTKITLPSDISEGTYYFGAIVDYLNNVDESDENNNTRSSNTITIKANEVSGKPDLIVTSVQVPSSASPGDKVNAVVKVKNQGKADTGTFKTGYYLSSNSNITTSDNRISECRFTNTPGRTAGTTGTCDFDVTLPSDLSPGTYYFGAIADDSNEVEESDEDNNSSRNSPKITITAKNTLPDLVVTAISNIPSTAQLGDTIQPTVTVANQGSADADKFYTGYYLSTNSTISTSDRRIKSCVHSSGRDAGNSGSCNFSFTLPSDLTAGTYYFGAIADYKGEIKESNEDNNSSRNNPKITIDTDGSAPTNLNGKVLRQDDQWRAEIRIDRLVEGRKSGTINYRALNCGGDLTYLGIEESAYLNGSYIFDQKITYGNCVQNCKVWLESDGSEYREFCNGRLTGSGSLEVTSQ